MIIIGDDEQEISKLQNRLAAAEFEIKKLGSFKYFLEIEVARLAQGIVLS